MRYKVPAGGTLRRNNFFDVRDADFQRALNFAIASKWIKVHLRDRYTYQLTDIGFAAGWKPEPTATDLAAAELAATRSVASEPLQPDADQSEPVTTAPESTDPVENDPIPTTAWKSPA